MNDEQKAELAAIGESDALQEALDEVGRQYPELSNEERRRSKAWRQHMPTYWRLKCQLAGTLSANIERLIVSPA